MRSHLITVIKIPTTLPKRCVDFVQFIFLNCIQRSACQKSTFVRFLRYLSFFLSIGPKRMRSKFDIEKVTFIKRAPWKIIWRAPVTHHAHGNVNLCQFWVFLRTSAQPWRFFVWRGYAADKVSERVWRSLLKIVIHHHVLLWCISDHLWEAEIPDIFQILAPLELQNYEWQSELKYSRFMHKLWKSQWSHSGMIKTHLTHHLKSED